jgi:hypothetical protein
MTNVRFAQGAENCIADRMHQNVSIRVPLQSFTMGNLDPPKDQFPAFGKSMDIVTNANMNHRSGW